MKYKQIQVQVEDHRAEIILNRPEQHNPLNPPMIQELSAAFDELNLNNNVNFIVIKGNGKSFCAGADIKWFSNAINRTEEENFSEYKALADLLLQIFVSPKVTIAAAHKNVFGGANGILAACDFAIVTNDALFSFSEVKLGIIPATILPFVAKRLSMQSLKKLMLSGMRIGAEEALLLGLVDYVVVPEQLMSKVNTLIEELSLGAPDAITACKKLIHSVTDGEISVHDTDKTAKILVQRILTEEGKEGTKAFLEKRKPNWIKPTKN